MNKSTLNIVLLLSAVLLLLTFAKSIYFTQKSGGTDLRTRIVASRLLATEHSPFFYKWRPSDGGFLLDPNDQPQRLVNGNVVTPATLYAIYPLAQLPYRPIRIIWTLLQWIALISTTFLVLRKSDFIHVVPLVIVIVGLITSDSFLYHVERGQMYVFYGFCFALIYYLHRSNSAIHNFFSGFASGLFFFFRPFAGILAPLLFVFGKTNTGKGWLIGFTFGCILFVLPNPKLWQSYLVAMQEYGNELLGLGGKIASHQAATIPTVIEEMTNLQFVQAFNIGGLNALPVYLLSAGLTLTNFTCFFTYGVIILCLSLYFYKTYGTNPANNVLFLFGFLIYILAELMLLTPRGSYNILQWYFPLLLIGRQFRHNNVVLLVLATTLLLMHNFPFVMPHLNLIAEIVFIILLLFAIFSKKNGFRKATS